MKPPHRKIDYMDETPLDWEALIGNSLKLRLPDFIWSHPLAQDDEEPRVLNLGAGKSPMNNAINLDRPEWDAPWLPYGFDSMDTVHAYHFLEHLSGDTLLDMIEEIARVLKPGGVFNYCVPYAMAPIAFMDPTHQSFWTEETMGVLLGPDGYNHPAERSTRRLKIQTQMIMGLTSSNLVVIGQLTKTVQEES